MNKIGALLASVLLFPAGSVSALSLAIYGTQFKAGQPQPEDALESSVESSADLDNLRTTARTIKYYPKLKFEIAGHADPAECAPSECVLLSSRRAALVAEFLLKMGVGPSQISHVTGYGTSLLMQKVIAGEEGPVNRRVEVNVQP